MSAQEVEASLHALWNGLADDTDGSFGGKAADEEEVDFAATVAKGVATQRDEIDKLLERCATNWRVERMSLVDRNILRMGAFELLHLHDVPANVAINEAVELAKRFGTADSRAFVNGILDRVARDAGRI
jgi:N utilization substance protein B